MPLHTVRMCVRARRGFSEAEETAQVGAFLMCAHMVKRVGDGDGREIKGEGGGKEGGGRGGEK